MSITYQDLPQLVCQVGDVLQYLPLTVYKVKVVMRLRPIEPLPQPCGARSPLFWIAFTKP
jgi:hypothetical protein